MNFSEELTKLDNDIELIDAKLLSLQEERKRLVDRRSNLLSLIDGEPDSIKNDASYTNEDNDIIDLSEDCEPNTSSSSISIVKQKLSSSVKPSDVDQWKRTGEFCFSFISIYDTMLYMYLLYIFN